MSRLARDTQLSIGRVNTRRLPICTCLSTYLPIYLSTYQAGASAELQRMNAFFTDVDQGSLEVETLPAPP